jgi:dTDP-4-amino-4,6-dideoxygalactose transaminase
MQLGAKYAVAVANGTAALHLAALALGVGGKSRVLTTPITFVASANCVLYCGGSVDFVDVDPESALLDLDALEIKLKKSPGLYAGVIPVDFAGLPVDLEKLRSIADRHGLWILEDACHAPGASFRSKAGTTGVLTSSVTCCHGVPMTGANSTFCQAVLMAGEMP